MVGFPLKGITSYYTNFINNNKNVLLNKIYKYEINW